MLAELTANSNYAMDKVFSQIIPARHRARLYIYSGVGRSDPQSVCAQQARKLVSWLSSEYNQQLYGNKQPASGSKSLPISGIWRKPLYSSLNNKNIYIENKINVISLLDEPKEKFLSQHNCNILAVTTIYEAMLIIQEEWGASYEKEKKEAILKTLEELETDLQNQYTAKIPACYTPSNFKLTRLQYMGKGIQCLELLASGKCS